MSKDSLAFCSAALVALGLLYPADARAWVDDYDITISSPQDVEAKRAQLIEFVWGAGGFPKTSSELVGKNIPSPVAGLDNLERVEKLRTSMPTLTMGTLVVPSYHFIPAHKNNRLVVVHQGHGCPISFDDAAKGSGGLQHTIKALLADGYAVLAVFMPLQTDDQCEKGKHGDLFAQAPAGSAGTRFFLEPTAQSLNYIARHYPYRDFNMVGFSGGGWTTTVYAAIDPRIKVSIPVAGSLPLYLRKTPYSNDEEQTHAEFYEIAGYPDLYILGSTGHGRAQIQVLNLNDPCCFSATFHDPVLQHVADKPDGQRDFESSVRLYEARIQLKALDAGSFRVVIDGGSKHTITDNVIETVIRPGLAASNGAHYIDLTANFSHFVDETAGMEDAARAAALQSRMNALLPGFYVPRAGTTPERYHARIDRALKGFAELRPKYQQVQRDFPAAFDAGIQHFRKYFPGFTPDVPVYLLHSLGEMDGGTRKIDGRFYLIFGADVIAEIHEPRDLTPFFDHELFHVEHHKYFPDCAQVWCPLWEEGLATYAAEVMNPGADDRQLLLTIPKPIRPAVDATWPAALCFTRARLFSVEQADIDALLVGGRAAKEFPDRFGYYVGLRVAEELGGEYKLPALTKMPQTQAKATLMAGIDRLIKKAGGCR